MASKKPAAKSSAAKKAASPKKTATKKAAPKKAAEKAPAKKVEAPAPAPEPAPAKEASPKKKAAPKKAAAKKVNEWHHFPKSTCLNSFLLVSLRPRRPLPRRPRSKSQAFSFREVCKSRLSLVFINTNPSGRSNGFHVAVRLSPRPSTCHWMACSDVVNK